jgi:inorganic pyrophosphatase
MTDFANLPLRGAKGEWLAVVETPRGSSVKYAFDPVLRVFRLKKCLSFGLVYPVDFGFFPSTKADDGDPLDLIIMHEAPTFAGLVLEVRVIGVVNVLQKEPKREVRNDRIVVVPSAAKRAEMLDDVRELGASMRKEIERFLCATDDLQKKDLVVLGWKGPGAAEKLISKAAEQYLAAGAAASNRM